MATPNTSTWCGRSQGIGKIPAAPTVVEHVANTAGNTPVFNAFRTDPRYRADAAAAPSTGVITQATQD